MNCIRMLSRTHMLYVQKILTTIYTSCTSYITCYQHYFEVEITNNNTKMFLDV